jgi:hypothetical protein
MLTKNEKAAPGGSGAGLQDQHSDWASDSDLDNSASADLQDHRAPDWGDDDMPDFGAPIRPRLTPLSWRQALHATTASELVAGLLDEGSLTVVYGASSAGKTFWALDLCAYVALGRAWHGRAVARGPVVYLATEGSGRFERRLQAAWMHHKPDDDDPELHYIPEDIDLCRTSADADLLIERVASYAPVLIVVDTLSRALSGGNENASDDMGAFVRNLDCLRRATGAAVMVIHHSGKNEAAGARGHSLLRAAADTEIEITADGGAVVATVTKQRERASGDEFKAELKVVEVGTEDDGTPITSCVVIPYRPDAAKAVPPTPRKALAALEAVIREHGVPLPAEARKAARSVTLGATLEGWRHMLRCDGLINPKGNEREQFRRIRVTLEDAGLIGLSGDFVWCVT